MKQTLTKAAAEAPAREVLANAAAARNLRTNEADNVLPRSRPGGGGPGGPQVPQAQAQVCARAGLHGDDAPEPLHRPSGRLLPPRSRRDDRRRGGERQQQSDHRIRIQSGPHEGPRSRGRRHHPSGNHAVRAGQQAQELFGVEHDPSGRRSVGDFIKNACKERIYPSTASKKKAPGSSCSPTTENWPSA